MLVGNITSIASGGIICVVLTYLTAPNLNVDQIGGEHSKIRLIINFIRKYLMLYIF